MTSDEDDELGDGGEPRARKKEHYAEFDCPECDANNPYGDGFGVGDTVRCLYCGADFDVFPGNRGRPRLRPK